MVVNWEQPLRDEERQAYEQSMRSFLQSGNTTRAAVQAGLDFHRARVDIAQPTAAGGPAPWSAVGELDERISLAKKAQDYIRTAAYENDFQTEKARVFQLDLMQFSVFLCADLDYLRSVVESYAPQHLRSSITSTEAILANFLQHRETPIEIHAGAAPAASATSSKRRRTKGGSNESDGSDDAFQPLVHSEGTRGQDRMERDRALRRDGFKCTITKDVEPDVCGYWPSAINDQAARRDGFRLALLTNILMYNQDLRRELANLFSPASQELTASDKTWNMISMNTQIHRYWGKAFFGIKWIGVEAFPGDNTKGSSKVETTQDKTEHINVRVQWHWLPDHVPDSLKSYLIRPEGERCDARRRLNLDSEEVVESIKQSLTDSFSRLGSLSTKGATVRDQDGRLVESGRFFTLSVETQDLEKTRALIEAQWLAVRMAALSGAAEVADDLSCKPPPAWPLKMLLPFLEDSEAEGERGGSSGDEET